MLVGGGNAIESENVYEGVDDDDEVGGDEIGALEFLRGNNVVDDGEVICLCSLLSKLVSTS